MRTSWPVLFALVCLSGCSTTQPAPITEAGALSQPVVSVEFRSCELVQSGTCTDILGTASRRYTGAAAGEPILCEGPDAEAYRLTWVRTFHNPVIARVQQLGTTASWRALRYGGMGGYDAGAVEEDRSGELTPDEWTRLVTTVDSVSFWSVPDALVDGELFYGRDGASWLIEGRRSGQYVSVQCQGTQGAVGARIEALGRSLLKATGMLPNDPREVY